MGHDNLPTYNQGREGLQVVYDWIMGTLAAVTKRARGFGALGFGFFGFGVGFLVSTSI